MLTILITIIHIFVSLVLILVILLQAGRGGGLSDMFGGGATQNQKLFGTETNTFLTRATSYCAMIFIVTCITLGYLTTNKSKSLLDGRRFEPTQTLPVLPEGAAPAPLPAAPALPSTPPTQSVPAAPAPVPSTPDASGSNAAAK